MPEEIQQLKIELAETRRLIEGILRANAYSFTQDVHFEVGSKIVGAIYGGLGAGTSILPPGWAYTNPGTGSYTITHGLNTASYVVVASVFDSSNVTTTITVTDRSANSFSIKTDQGGAANRNFFFILMRI